jgi:hypothetical protein
MFGCKTLVESPYSGKLAPGMKTNSALDLVSWEHMVAYESNPDVAETKIRFDWVYVQSACAVVNHGAGVKKTRWIRIGISVLTSQPERSRRGNSRGLNEICVT